MMRSYWCWLSLGVLLLGLGGCSGAISAAQGSEGAPNPKPELGAGAEQMTNARMGALLQELDPDISGQPGNWVISFEGASAQVVTDANANRMRIMIPVGDASSLGKDKLYRMLQANFESALDARYAVANDLVWATFIHPLAPLTANELRLAVAQTFNAAATYETSYSSGLFQFGGGDHSRDKVFDEILRRGTPL
jgi:hypothetical protein